MAWHQQGHKYAIPALEELMLLFHFTMEMTTSKALGVAHVAVNKMGGPRARDQPPLPRTCGCVGGNRGEGGGQVST